MKTNLTIPILNSKSKMLFVLRDQSHPVTFVTGRYGGVFEAELSIWSIINAVDLQFLGDLNHLRYMFHSKRFSKMSAVIHISWID